MGKKISTPKVKPITKTKRKRGARASVRISFSASAAIEPGNRRDKAPETASQREARAGARSGRRGPAAPPSRRNPRAKAHRP
jgi:hypothetical protein